MFITVGREHVVVGLGEHGLVVVEGEVLGEELVGQLVRLEERLQLHDPGDVAGLEPGKRDS